MSGQFLSGDRHPNAKLTEDLVLEARMMAARDPSPGIIERLSVQYGVSRPQMSAVLTGRCWAHVPGALPPGFSVPHNGRKPRTLKPRLSAFKPIEGEEWRPVVGYEGTHEVSSLGRVRSMPRVVEEHRGNGSVVKRRVSGGMMKIFEVQTRNDPARLMVTLGAQRSRSLPAVVAEAFLGPRPHPRALAIHKDRDPKNCRADNLEYVTPQGLADLKQELGTMARGERIGAAKLKEVQIDWIRELVARGTYKQYEIAEELGMSNAQISRIVNRKQWRHVV